MGCWQILSYAHWSVNRRVTIRDIAKAANVHHTTVSRALRKDRQIPELTRVRIESLAVEMGYSPDPALASLMRYRSSKLRSSYKGALAWITNYPTREGWRMHEKIGYYTGAKARAVELGYSLDEFWLNEPGLNSRRASGILSARNIQGLIFLPQPRARAHLHLDWSRFSALTISHTLTAPHLHVVTNHHFRSMALLMRKIRSLGYRRPGFVCRQRIHESVDRAWAAAFATYQAGPLHRQVPLLLYQDNGFQDFSKWIQRHKPDVLVTHDESVFEWLDRLRLRVPEDIGVAAAALHGLPPECSGLNENNEVVGALAVDLVVEMIHKNQKGVPEIPVTTLVEGSWVDGTTLRLQKKL